MGSSHHWHVRIHILLRGVFDIEEDKVRRSNGELRNLLFSRGVVDVLLRILHSVKGHIVGKLKQWKFARNSVVGLDCCFLLDLSYFVALLLLTQEVQSLEIKNSIRDTWV